MKVYLGKYEPTISISDAIDRMFFWVDEDSEFLEKVTNWLSYLQWASFDTLDTSRLKKTWVLNLEYYINSKMTKKEESIRVDPWDVYSADYTLALVIVPVLQKLKETKAAAPHIPNEDLPEHLQMSDEALAQFKKDGTVDDNYFARWDYILDEMIWAFQQTLDEDWEDQYTTGNIDFCWKRLDNGYCEMYPGPNHTYARDEDAIRAHYERMKQGRVLFAKYFDSLWN